MRSNFEIKCCKRRISSDLKDSASGLTLTARLRKGGRKSQQTRYIAKMLAHKVKFKVTLHDITESGERVCGILLSNSKAGPLEELIFA